MLNPGLDFRCSHNDGAVALGVSVRRRTENGVNFCLQPAYDLPARCADQLCCAAPPKLHRIPPLVLTATEPCYENEKAEYSIKLPTGQTLLKTLDVKKWMCKGEREAAHRLGASTQSAIQALSGTEVPPVLQSQSIAANLRFGSHLIKLPSEKDGFVTRSLLEGADCIGTCVGHCVAWGSRALSELSCYNSVFAHVTPDPARPPARVPEHDSLTGTINKAIDYFHTGRQHDFTSPHDAAQPYAQNFGRMISKSLASATSLTRGAEAEAAAQPEVSYVPDKDSVYERVVDEVIAKTYSPRTLNSVDLTRDEKPSKASWEFSDAPVGMSDSESGAASKAAPSSPAAASAVQLEQTTTIIPRTAERFRAYASRSSSVENVRTELAGLVQKFRRGARQLSSKLAAKQRSAKSGDLAPHVEEVTQNKTSSAASGANESTAETRGQHEPSGTAGAAAAPLPAQRTGNARTQVKVSSMVQKFRVQREVATRDSGNAAPELSPSH